jgi:nucleoside-diphosphate-sugar epimerase
LRHVTVYGGCGPLAGAAFGPLAARYAVRLTDVLSPAAGAARVASRWPGAFTPPVDFPPPHEFQQVDIGDSAAVLAAADGAGALVNCSVVRDQLEAAFRVNTIGAFNVFRAAVMQGIRRVVHTGPQVLNAAHPLGYAGDFDLPDEAPIRAGANLYFHSKYLGLEIGRVFAQNHGLEVAALLFSIFVNPAQPGRRRGGHLPPATVAWRDAGMAVRQAVAVPVLPSPFEVLRIVGDLPHGRFSNAKARRVLQWQPEESLAALWRT